jgi:hypothetical protein
MTFRLLTLLAAALSVGSLISCSSPQTLSIPTKGNGPSSANSVFDVLTQHNNAQRTGASLYETALSPDTVKSGRFQRLFDWTVDGQIYAQPLYVSHVNYYGDIISMVIVATMNNSVYAFRAPSSDSYQQPDKAPLWQINKNVLGVPLNFKFMTMSSGFLGRLGMLAIT